MNVRRSLYNSMHFIIHNGFLFTVGVMCFVHVILFLIMLAAGVTPLVFFNTFSIIVYGICMILCNSGHIIPVYISIISEVTAYTVVSTHYVGLRCSTYCFLFSIVPIIIYFGSFLFKGIKRLYIVLLLVMNFAVFGVLYIIFADAKPAYMVDPVTRIVLVLFSTFVMVFSTIFYNFLYIYSSEFEMKKLELKNEQLSVDAKEDELTTLLNRRGFLPIIDGLINSDKGSVFCVAFCDIDNFKQINDSYGHDAGDEVLLHITGILKKELTGCDICRWGGEEIVILMKDYNMTAAREIMEDLRKMIETTPTFFYNKRLFITITIGLAENNDIFTDAEGIIKAADQRMYYGKQHGKNQVIYS